MRFLAKIRVVAPALQFLAVWAVLDALVNLRYPAPEPGFWYLLPSLDVTAVLVAMALVAAIAPRRRETAGVRAALAACFIVIRLMRAGDALVRMNYYRPLNLYLDVPLLPDLVRLLRSTVRWPALAVGALLGAAGLALVGWVTARALASAGRFLARGRKQRAFFAAVLALLVALTPLWPRGPLHEGLFGTSIVPELVRQARYALAANQLRRTKTAEIRAAGERLQHTPRGLERLRGADVLFVLVESYGATVYRNPRFAAAMHDVHATFADRLGGVGFSVASALLDSSTYGGGSWLAHATLATGVRVGDGLEFALIRQITPRPRTMAWFFQQAGYRTVLVQPGTTRPWPEGEVDGFDRKYYAPDLAYEGPSFGWATMPDQYVLDFVHRREIAGARRPLFVEYALVSSHAPWSVQPPVVEDWSRLERGIVYRDLPARQFVVPWERLHEGGPAYLASLAYDFDVLGRYLPRLRPETLIIVMGDHQPSGSITDEDPSPAVPVHVISRDRGLVDLFVVRRGYTPGLAPADGHARPMAAFLPDLLQTLSVVAP